MPSVHAPATEEVLCLSTWVTKSFFDTAYLYRNVGLLFHFRMCVPVCACACVRACVRGAWNSQKPYYQFTGCNATSVEFLHLTELS